MFSFVQYKSIKSGVGTFFFISFKTEHQREGINCHKKTISRVVYGTPSKNIISLFFLYYPLWIAVCDADTH